MTLFTPQRRILLLLSAALMFATPNIVHAQFGALGNMAKGKALEALNDKVMSELEKKFTEIVAKEPISEAAKAATVKKLTEIARPIVKRFIDGAASGKPPNPMELVQTVMKDILPRVPEVIAATQTEGGGVAVVGAPTQTAQGQQAYGASPVQQEQVQEKPKIAVYASGAKTPALNEAMANRLIAALSNSGRYMALDEYKEFFLQADKEPKGGAASLNSEQTQRLGWNFGAEYVCVAEITAMLDEHQVSARITNVGTGAIVAIGVADSPLKTLADVADASEQIVTAMFKNAPPPVYTQNNTQNITPIREEAAAEVTVSNAAPIASAGQKPKQTWWYKGVEYTEDEFGNIVPVKQESASSSGEPIYAKSNDVGAEEKNTRFYFAPKYQSPVGAPTSWGGINLEIGWVWRNGALFGMDFNFGVDRHSSLVGGGLGVGKEYTLRDQMQMVIGGSVGFWYLEYAKKYSGYYYDDYYYIRSYDFFAPFVKYRWNSLEVTYRGLMGITGGGGFGYNSHQTMVGYYLATKGRGSREEEKNAWFYFAPKYQTPLGTPVSWGGVNIEMGWVWRSGKIFGIDISGGVSRDHYDRGENIFGGIGLSLGKEFDLGNQMQLVIGGSAGLWGIGENVDYPYNNSVNFLAPFVKLRWKSFEITNRGLLGFYQKYDHSNGDYNSKSGFGYNSHQLMAGFYFGGRKAR